MSFWIGIFGLLLTLYGRWQRQPGWKQQHGYFWGAVILLASALLDREPLLISSEIVIVLGTGLAFTQLPHKLKASLTISAAIIALFILIGLHLAITPHLLLGMTGFALGATGFALINDRLQLISAICLTIYTIINSFLGQPAAPIFALLNFIFAILAWRALRNTSTKNNS